MLRGRGGSLVEARHQRSGAPATPAPRSFLASLTASLLLLRHGLRVQKVIHDDQIGSPTVAYVLSLRA
jgi:hypothetical protein